MTSPPPRTPRSRRRTLARSAIAAGIATLAVAAVLAVTDRSTGPAAGPAAAAVRTPTGELDRVIQALQDTLARNPDDAAAWAQLGSAYVERSRVTGDVSYQSKAQGALDRSLQLVPVGNGPAMIGLGALANARHDFAAGKEWGTRAVAALPDTAAAHGVLADALTQLGEADAATAAVQRMLDVRPSVAAFTRASYDLELHGRLDEARVAMERALHGATSADDVAFARYHLGELELGRGRVDAAQAEYELGLAAAPGDHRLRQGMAKVAAARGDTAGAIAAYREIVAAAPLPQHVHELAVLLTAAGLRDEAAVQFDVLDRQHRLAAAAGATDDLTAAVVAADRGDAAAALRHAEAEWSRRQHVLVADALAWALHLAGRDAEALPLADRALALGTVDASFAYHRGMILRGLGRDAEAIEQLDAALRIDPHFSTLHAPLAGRALAELRSGR